LKQSTQPWAMAITCCEVTWLLKLSKDLTVTSLKLIDLKCKNQATLYTTVNLVYHERTKHIEVSCHFVRNQLKSKVIKAGYVPLKP